MDSAASAAVAAAAAAAAPPYPSSVDSSPRSRTAEQSPFFDDPLPSPSPSKLRLMCSFGGRIVPRPTDKSLCYLGGETRMVSLDRTSSLPDLLSRLSRSLLQSRPFTLKYQLPHEDLDSLISVTHDEDLDNLLDEYDRLHSSAGSASKSSRIRLFLFPSKSESAPSSINTISSLLDDSKSETWFVDALNGALDRGMSVDTLLGLEDDSSIHSRATDPALTRPESSNKILPDSPMLDTTSSFGSASSGAYISNLPPIRVRAEDRPPDSVVTAGQEMLKEMGFAEHAPAAPPPPIVSPTDGNAVQGDEDDDDDEDDNCVDRHSHIQKPDFHGLLHKPPPPVASTAQQKAAAPDPNVTRGMYYQDKPLPVVAGAAAAAAVAATPVAPAAVTDPSYRGYLMPEQIQFQQQQYHQQQQLQPQPPQQQQQQFTHYINPATGAVVPMPAYYQLPIQQPHHYDPQMQMYFMPMRPNAQYNLPPPSLGDAAAAAAAATAKTGAAIPNSVGSPAVPLPKVTLRPEMPVNPANMYRVAPAAAPGPPAQAPQLIHVTPDQAHAYAGMGYQIVHHNQPHYPTQSATGMTNYGYEYAADPLPPQMYYTQAQATSQPQLSSQYQSMASTAAPVIPDASLAPQAQLQPQARS